MSLFIVWDTDDNMSACHRGGSFTRVTDIPLRQLLLMNPRTTLSMIQLAFNEDSSALTEVDCCHVLRHGDKARIEVLQFLQNNSSPTVWSSSNCRDLINELLSTAVARLDENRIRRLVGIFPEAVNGLLSTAIGRLDENRIRRLVGLFPQAVTAEGGNGIAPWEVSLYTPELSLDLRLFMIWHISDKVEKFIFYPPQNWNVDANNVEALCALLTKVDEFTDRYGRWTVGHFKMLLGAFFRSTTTVQSVGLLLPHETLTAGAMEELDSCTSLGTCTVTKLKLALDNSGGAHFVFPRFIGNMRNLETLDLTFDCPIFPFHRAGRCLVNVLEKLGSLRSLAIEAAFCKDLYFLPTLLDAVAKHRQLSSLRLFDKSDKEEQRTRMMDQWHNHQTCILSLLQLKNTVLENVVLHPSSDDDLSLQIRYYTTLNRCGRGKARQLDITGSEFLRVLTCANDNRYILPGDTLDATALQYGLLRENPSTWSNGFFDPCAPMCGLFGSLALAPKQKRKYPFEPDTPCRVPCVRPCR